MFVDYCIALCYNVEVNIKKGETMNDFDKFYVLGLRHALRLLEIANQNEGIDPIKLINDEINERVSK